MYFPSDDEDDFDNHDYYGDLDLPEEYDNVFNCFDFYDGYDEFDSSYGDKECDCSIRYGELKDISNSEIRQLSRCKNILEKIRNGRQSDPFCDAIIKVEDTEFPVHKIVLTSNSNYFEAMFIRPFNEKSEKCIVLQGITKDVFAILIDFLYGGNVELTEETLLKIYQAADMFCIDSLTMECREFLKVNWRGFESMVNAFSLIEIFNAEEVREEILEEIYRQMNCNSTSGLIKDLPFSFVKIVMANVDLQKIDLTVNLVNLLIEWISAEPKERLTHVEYIVKNLALNLLPWPKIELFQTKVADLFFEQKQFEQKQIFEQNLLSRCEQLKDSILALGLKFCMVTEDKLEAFVTNFNTALWKWNTGTVKLTFEVQDCLYKSDQVYFMGNKKSLQYSTYSQKVKYLREMRFSRIFYSACFLNNDIIVVGGLKGHTKEDVREIMRYQTESDIWQSTALNWNHPKSQSGLISEGESIFIVGGTKKSTISRPLQMVPTDDIYKLMPKKKKKFTRICKLDRDCFKPDLAVHDNKLYIFPKEMPFSMLFESIQVVDLKNGEAKTLNIESCESGTSVHRKPIGTCKSVEGVLLMFSYAIATADHDQVFLLQLYPSGKTKCLGFLPQLPADSIVANRSESVKKWYFVSVKT